MQRTYTVLQVQTLHYSAEHRLHGGSLFEGQAEVFGSDDHIQFVQVQNQRANMLLFSALYTSFDVS